MRALFGHATGTMLVALSLLAGADARAAAQPSPAFDWQTFVIPDFGTRLEYPTGLFEVFDGESEKGFGERCSTADGLAFLSIYSRPNEAADTPGSCLKNNLRVARAALEYERVTRSFFAISSTREGLVYYSRCNFSSVGAGAMHCFDLIYPQREERAWDAIVTRISRSLRPLAGGR